MQDTASVIAQAKAGTLPPQWSVFRPQLAWGCGDLIGVGVVFAAICVGIWVIGGVVWALLASLWQRLFSSSLDIPLGWWFLAVSLFSLVLSVYLLVRQWIWPAMVIITDEAAIEYLPERWFQRLHILDFAAIQGMVVHVHYSYGETNMLFSTQYRLELRDAHGGLRQWSFTRRYGQTKHDTRAAVYEQVVKHFERGHTNLTEGLSHSGSSYYDRDGVRNTWYDRARY